MSERLFFSEARGRVGLKDIEELEKRIVFFSLNFYGDLLMCEEEVCKKLSISARSMRRYRNQNYFRYIRIEEQIFYHR
jgi:hypothetical protein